MTNRQFEKKVLPILEDRVMRQLRRHNVYNEKQYDEIRKSVRYSLRVAQKSRYVRH